MAKLKLTIDNTEVEVEQGSTVLEAAQASGIYIPALCAHPDLPPAPGTKTDDVIYIGVQPCQSSNPNVEFPGCGLCVVEVEGVKDLPTSCSLTAAEGMVVHTSTNRVLELRRENLKTILSRHPHACLTCSQREGCSPFESCPNDLPVLERCCSKLGYCELQAIAEYVGIKEGTPRYIYKDLPVMKDEPLFNYDFNLCIGCTRCVRICRDVRGIEALGFVNRNGELIAGPISPTLKESGCKFCGACVEVCPTGALMDRDVRRADRQAKLVPCTHACPAEIDVPRYVRLIAEGKYSEALAVVREKVPFPEVLGNVCFHPCESVCRRGQLDEPIAICALKRFAAEHDMSQQPEKITAASPTGKKVAILGSGPAGLTAGYYLVKRGHSVTLFETLPEPGGMMKVGIPEYRLPRGVLNNEVEAIKRIGVEIETDRRIDSLDDLREPGYDAIFVATGAHRGLRMGIDGENDDTVIEAVSFLRDVNQGKDIRLGDRVGVVGGGNAAIDASRTALRLGAKEVTVIYRRSQEEMPASPEEIEGAIEEGVKIMFLSAPKGVSRGNSKLVMQCLRMELGEPDASGRRRPVPIEGSEFEMVFDTVIAAIGQTSEVPDGIELDEKAGRLMKVDSETLVTGSKGVFAGGDVASGPASVIEAIAAGRKAAASIDRYLGSSGDIDEVLTANEEINVWLGRDETFCGRRREVMAHLPAEQRTGGFSQVEVGFDEQKAVSEAKRCLRCDLRLQISPVPLPPDEWMTFTQESVDAAPESDGVFRLFDEQKTVIYIGSGPDLRRELQERLDSDDDWITKVRYLHFEENLMYTMRESELMQQFMQEHGRLPEGNDELF